MNMQKRRTHWPPEQRGGQCTALPCSSRKSKSPKGRSCGAATISASGTDTSLASPSPQEGESLADPELGPAFASTSGDSFKLGKGGVGGIPFLQLDSPSGNQNAANMESSWRRFSYSQALRTSNWCQKKRALPLLAVSSAFLIICS